MIRRVIVVFCGHDHEIQATINNAIQENISKYCKCTSVQVLEHDLYGEIKYIITIGFNN